jgi:hypothetical protein
MPVINSIVVNSFNKSRQANPETGSKIMIIWGYSFGGLMMQGKILDGKRGIHMNIWNQDIPDHKLDLERSRIY